MQQELNCLETLELHTLALWVLKFGYGLVQPTRDDVLVVIRELNQIYEYEQKH